MSRTPKNKLLVNRAHVGCSVAIFFALLLGPSHLTYSLAFGDDQPGNSAAAADLDLLENTASRDLQYWVNQFGNDIVGFLGPQDDDVYNHPFYEFVPWLVISSAAGLLAIILLVRTKNGKYGSDTSQLMIGCLNVSQQKGMISPERTNGKDKRKKKSGKNRRWIVLYIMIVLLWALVFTTTIRSWLSGTEALVDSYDISYYTLPLLIFNLIFVGATFLILVAYFVHYRKSVEQQEEAKRNVNEGKQRQYDDHNNVFAGHARTQELCSIIIPARNEENVIEDTIRSCLEQTHMNIEVVVVCHNCSDSTFEHAKSVADGRVRAFELNTKEAGKGIALNFGVQMASAEYLLVLDGDGRLNESFIEDAMPLFAVQDYAAVQGRYIPSNRNYNFITRMLSLEGDLWSTPFMTIRTIGTKRTPLGGTGYIVRRDALTKVGGFANHLVDDYELTFRLLRQNYRIAFAPKCVNYDEKPARLDIMLNQRARWLRGFLNLTKIRVAEPRDIVGNLFWVNPLTAFTGMALLLIAAYSTMHYVAFLYYPFHYSYIPITLWIGLTLSTFGLYTGALVMQYGKTGLKYAAWLPIYLPFSNYYMIVALKAFFVKSWADTKTVHGFVAHKIRVAPRIAAEEKGE